MQNISLSKNKLREKIKSRGYAIGTCTYSLNPSIAQIAGYCGMDFCRVDSEHSWRRDDSIENIIRASDTTGMSTILRIDNGDLNLIRKGLELGPDAIIISQIKTVEEVENIVKGAKFPPKGERGFSNLNQSAKYGLIDSEEWIKWSNEEILIGVMIETMEAVKNIDDILSVEGLDLILIGPSDLSLSYNLGTPNLENPIIQNSILQIIESAKRNKIYTMMGVGYPWEENAKKYLNMGVDMIEFGHDYSILGTVWKHLVQSFKS